MNQQNHSQDSLSAQSFSPPAAPVATKKPRLALPLKDRIFSLLSLLSAYFLILSMPASRSPFGMLLSVFLLYVLAFAYLYVHKFRPSVRAWVTSTAFFLPSVSLLTAQNELLHFLSVSLSLLGLLFVISDGVSRVGKGLLDSNLLTNAADACLGTPAKGFPRFFSAMLPGPGSENGQKRLRTLLWILAGICIAIVPTVLVAMLLSYDPQFSALLSAIFSLDASGLFRFLRDLLFAIPVAAIVFGALFAAKAKEAPRRMFQMPEMPDLTRPLLCAAVTPILILYVIFFISQRSYYLSALTHTLPTGLTFSEYAREGFFELCTVAVINAVILWVFTLFFAKKKEGRNLLSRIYAGTISLFTLILIATAISKMVLYIDAYGLTQKRIWASWLMLVLAFCFAVILVAQVIKKTPLVPILAIGFLCLCAPITLLDVDAVVANYNVEAYLDGDLPSVDLVAMVDLGTSSVPALVKLRDACQAQGDLQHLEVCNAILSEQEAELETAQGIFSFNIPDALARRALEE